VLDLHLNSGGDTSALEALIERLIGLLRAAYVFPEVAAELDQSLCAHLRAGRYAVAEGPALAELLTDDLQAVSRDKHLRVRHSDEVLPPHQGDLYEDPQWLAAYAETGRLENFGFARVERLPGNIGYIDLRAFYDAALAAETGVAAMNLLAHTSALIIDLRRNTGGDPAMVALLTTYLFEGEPVHLNSLYLRTEDRLQQFWTLPYVPGRRYGDKPVYVLCSSRTFSAAEEFTYNLKTRGRATAVGERTRGGAHPGSRYRLSDHFEVFIPNGRAINPISNANWEGVGVEPDVATPQEQAFTVAYAAALREVAISTAGASCSAARRLGDEAHSALAQLKTDSREA
jgi:hypothetical protein